MTSKIEQSIDDIDAYLDQCKYQAFSNNKIIVNKDEIDELLRELRESTPDEIKRYQKIITNKEAILNDAKQKAQALIDEAAIKTNKLINEHEIMQQAYAQANDVVGSAAEQAKSILDKATTDANAMKIAAVQYTDSLLADVENVLSKSINSTNSHYDALLTELTNYDELIRSNRAELNQQDPIISAAPSGKELDSILTPNSDPQSSDNTAK